MAKIRLTKKQRELGWELRHLMSILGLDPAEIVAEADPEGRTSLRQRAQQVAPNTML